MMCAFFSKPFLCAQIFYVLCFWAPLVLAQECYTAKEAEAEQGIRIHSELMVIGLNCQHIAKGPGGQNLYLAYRGFSDKHAAVFAEYDDIMLRKLGSEEALRALRTDFSNVISLEAARIRPDVFCARYAPRIAAVSVMSAETLRQWAATPYDGTEFAKPLCVSAP